MPQTQRIAPTIDLVLLSHGDLAHTGLFPYAFCRWGLRAPCYSTLPVQATARIAVTEDVEGLRDEQEMDDSDMGEDSNDQSVPEAETNQTGGDPMEGDGETKSPAREPKSKFVATIHEVNEAFDSVNTLRYSQPTHLQGACPSPSDITHSSAMAQESARGSPSPRLAPVTPLAVRSGKYALRPPGPLSML